MMVGRSAMAAHLRQPGHARLDAMPLPIALVHFPIEAVAGLGGSGMGARADDAHVAAQHVEKLRQLIDAGLAQETARSEEHTSELQSLMRLSYAGFFLKK